MLSSVEGGLPCPKAQPRDLREAFLSQLKNPSKEIEKRQERGFGITHHKMKPDKYAQSLISAHHFLVLGIHVRRRRMPQTAQLMNSFIARRLQVVLQP